MKNITIRKKVFSLSIISSILVFLIVLGSLYLRIRWDEIQATNRAVISLKKIVDLNTRDVGKLKRIQGKLVEKTNEFEVKIRELKRWKTSILVYVHYRDSGTLYKWSWLTPELIYRCLEYREKYYHLTMGFNYDSFSPEDFFILWCSNETHFNPDRYCIAVNESGSKDYWIMQMNECHYIKETNPKKHLWRRIEVMFPHLKNKPDWDVEKNIAVWSLWLGEQKTHGVWDIWTGRKNPNKKGWKDRPDIVSLFYKLKKRA